MPEPLGESQDSPTIPRCCRRWQFSLATLLIVVTIAVVVARWLAQPEAWPDFQKRFRSSMWEHDGDVVWGRDSGPHVVWFRGFRFADGVKPDDAFLKQHRADLARLGPFGLILPPDCAVTDAGISVLADLPHLECLKLSSETTDAAIEHIAKMESLRFVDLNYTAMTAEGIAQLRGQRPDLAVWTRGDWTTPGATTVQALPAFADDKSPLLKLVDNNGRVLVTLAQDQRAASYLQQPYLDRFRVLSLPSGDVVVFAFSSSGDSGVELIRLAITQQQAKLVWATRCEGLHIDYDNTYRHDAAVQSHDDKLVVRSHGSDGAFIELRDLETGGLLNRWHYGFNVR